MKKKSIVFASVLASLMLVSSCGPVTPTTNPTTVDPTTTTVDPTQTTSLKEFEGIVFSNSSIDYDGNSHTILATNIPSFAQVTYINAGPYTDVGSYTIKARFEATGYNTLELTATLTISKIAITGVEFISKSFEFDGKQHSIEISGQLPTGGSVVYSCVENEEITNTALDVGVYNIKAKICAPNYNDLELSAELKITANEKKRYIEYNTYSNSLIFQNALDNNRLYSYSNQSLTKLTNDQGTYISSISKERYVYLADAIYSKSIKLYNGSEFVTIASGNIDYMVRFNDTIYYARNDVFGSKSGIYSIDISQEEPKSILLSYGKAKYLQYFDGAIYFADGNNDYKLSSITIGGSIRRLRVDKKIKCLTVSNGMCFYTVNGLLGDYIEKYVIETQEISKLTMDAGLDLTYNPLDGYLYYINNDILTSTVIGKGIYKVNASLTSNLPGTKIISSDDAVCSLSIIENNIIYYDINGYKLNYAPLTRLDSMVNILDGFVAPEETPLSFGGKTKAYKNTLYFIDIYDGKTLRAYNTISKFSYAVNSSSTKDFTIEGNYLYFNQVTKLVDNDLYRVNIKTGGEPELVNTLDSNDIVSDGKYLYYSQKNEGGFNTAIHKCDLDGGNDTVIYDKGCYNLRIVGRKLYVIENKKAAVYGTIKSFDLDNLGAPTVVVDKNTSTFEVSNNVIYFRELYLVAGALKRLAKINIDGTTGYEVLVTEKTDPIELIVSGNFVYYFNYAESAINTAGLYKISTNGGTAELLLACNSTYYCSSMSIIGNNLYFSNHYLFGTFGDSHLYKVSVSGGEATKIR